jgi:hypothetical protein
MHPSLSRAFQRNQEHDPEHPCLVDLIATKQNKTKQTTFFHGKMKFILIQIKFAIDINKK